MFENRKTEIGHGRKSQLIVLCQVMISFMQKTVKLRQKGKNFQGVSKMMINMKTRQYNWPAVLRKLTLMDQSKKAQQKMTS